jgi:hypothetical protein
MMISKDKQYRTRDGREVRIYATDGHPSEPVHGAFQDYSCAWNSTMWRHDGTNVYGKGESDLIEVKQRIKRTVWLNVFRNGEVVSTSEPPDHYITTIFACVPVEIDCEEGEGL